MEGFPQDLQAVCTFREPILFHFSEKGATVCKEQFGSVLLMEDQSDPTRTLTEYLEDKKDVDSRLPKGIHKQYKLAVPVVP